MNRDAIPRRAPIDLEKGKPTCQTGKMLQVLQALGLDLTVGGGSNRPLPGETPWSG
jgi:hypothetical protein